MVNNIYVAAVLIPAGLLALSLTLYSWWRSRRQRPKDFIGNLKNNLESSQTGVVKVQQQSNLHHHQQIDLDSRRRLSNTVHPRGVSLKPLFSWDDHPSLVNDAVENGWSQFAFTGYMSSSPSSNSRSRLLGLCTPAENGKDMGAEISWEVCQGSADFMQKIRLNSGLKIKTTSTGGGGASPSAAASVIRTALPLPGPPLASFPQEAYFEITILSIASDENEPNDGTVKECERAKLIQETLNSKSSSESLVHFAISNKVNNIEELKHNGMDDEDEDEGVMLSVGLTSGGSAPLKLPGSYPGSIGFNSNGSVYLDGMKLVFESEKEEWGKTEKVIGCGFDPKQKKVFFTVDSELVHVINCKTEEFSTPLYPTLAANADIMVLINLGQSVFKYAAAQRTPNPCFVGPLVNNGSNGAIGYEDSRELFSMGMIDSQWFNRTPPLIATHNNANGLHHDNASDTDDESSDEIELFEIVVEDSN